MRQSAAEQIRFLPFSILLDISIQSFPLKREKSKRSDSDLRKGFDAVLEGIEKFPFPNPKGCGNISFFVLNTGNRNLPFRAGERFR